MTLWTIYVESIKDNEIIEIQIDSESTFLELRKKVADKIGVRWQDLILVSKKDYDLNYNSKKLSEIDSYDIYNECTLAAVFDVNGGSDNNSLKYNK